MILGQGNSASAGHFPVPETFNQVKTTSLEQDGQSSLLGLPKIENVIKPLPRRLTMNNLIKASMQDGL